MAPRNQHDDQNDATTSQPQTEVTTATKRPRLTTAIDTLTSPLPSLPSTSSNPPSDSLNASPLPTLPFELITEILYRIPVKFLLQLKCICKSWNSLISDPKFAKKHLRVSTTRHHLILSYMNPSRKFTLTTYPLSSIFTTDPMQLEYPLKNRNRFDLLVGSCDGILCFAADQKFTLLFNPSIRKFKKLPKLKNPRKKGSYTVYSFGYDNVTDDYKVVAVFCYCCDSGVNRGYKTLVKVYTLSTDRWRRIQEFPFGFPFDESGKFVSGTVNWLAYPNSNSSSWIIVSLDLGNESYEEVSLPDYGGVKMVHFTLCVLRDCLCILSYGDSFSDIWIMKEYGKKESWSKLFTFPYMMGAIRLDNPLYAYEDGRVLLECQSDLIVYDYRDGTFKTLEIQHINYYIAWKSPEVYIESLVSPCF